MKGVETMAKNSEYLNKLVRVVNTRKPDTWPPITVEYWRGQGWAVDIGERRIGGRFKTRKQTIAFLEGIYESMTANEVYGNSDA